MTTIDVPADQLYRLAAALEDLAGVAHQLDTGLAGAPPVARSLQATIEGFLGDHRTAARALAGQLHWLGDTIGAVARSWVRLDREVLADGGTATP